MLDLRTGDAQLRHIDRAWAATVHAFQGRTVDNVIAAMEANHVKLTTQKSFYVEISRARDRAELVTDDRNALRETLEAVTGERIAALEAVEPGEGEGPGGRAGRGSERPARGRWNGGAAKETGRRDGKDPRAKERRSRARVVTATPMRPQTPAMSVWMDTGRHGRSCQP